MTRPAPVALVACLLLVSASTSAQTVGGRVLDRGTRHAVPWLAVAVLDDTNAVLARTTTDSAGVFYAPLTGSARVHLRFGAGENSGLVSDTLSVAGEEFLQREFVVDLMPVYSGAEVETPVSLRPGEKGPEYPDELRKKDEAGEVVASFVVDTSGKAVLESLHILSTTHPAFVSSVRKALATRRYVPAEIAGARVQQLVEQSFAFHVKIVPTVVPDSYLPFSGGYVPQVRP